MDTKKKILFINPHFSTGGSCEVSRNKIELLKDEAIIKVVEYSFLSSIYVIHRNQVIGLVGEDNFYSLHGNKGKQLQEIVELFAPDVIAIEEFPEMFMDRAITEWLYRFDRPYKIIETTHDSSFNPKNKVFWPDEFVFVSAYNLLKYSHVNVPARVIEYPVDIKDGKSKSEAINKLGLDPTMKHVVIVGLFTQRKNQKYAFYLASRLEQTNVQFHFLGNQAENFADYWKPLMDKKPSNCIVWGERDDVETFLEAADLFLFPSKGDKFNKELQPIVIKQAQKFFFLPKLLFNLDVYLNKYDDAINFHYLTGDLNDDTQKIIDILQPEMYQTRKEKEIIIIGTYPNIPSRKKLTRECIQRLESLGRRVMLVSHYPVDRDTQKMADFYIYDAHNPLTHHSYYTHFFRDTDDYYAQVNINQIKDSNQSLTVLTNMFNAFKFAKLSGFERAFYLTFDVLVEKEDLPIIEQGFRNTKDTCYLGSLNTPFGKGIQTNGMFFNIDFFLKTFDDVRTPEDYNAVCERSGCQNFLEDYLAKKLQGLPDVTIIHNPEETLLKKSGLGTSSNSEYYAMLPVEGEPDKFMLYIFSYNKSFNHRISVRTATEYGESKDIIDFQKNSEYKRIFNYDGKPITINLDFYDNDEFYQTKRFVIDETAANRYKDAGIFRLKRRPNIKIVHLQTTINDEREQNSRTQLMEVGNYGWGYHLHANVPYTDLPPKFNCQRPQCVHHELFDEPTVQRLGTAITPAHYGCYEAFKNAILSEFDDDIDYLMVCEGDCKLELSTEQFVQEVENILNSTQNHNIGIFSFGDANTLEHGWPQSPLIEEMNDKSYITNHIIGLQCIVFPKRVKEWLKNKARTYPWDAADMYFNSIFKNSPYKMAIVKKRLTSQFDGYSLIDRTEKKFL